MTALNEEILKHSTEPEYLERLYRKEKKDFSTSFMELYPQLKGQPLADFWKIRLGYKSEQDGISWGTFLEFRFVIILGLLAGLFAKTQQMFSIDEDFFYSRNIGFIIFPFLATYFAWKNKIELPRLMGMGLIFLVSLIYINLLPDDLSSDTLNLACLHLPLMLWAVLGFSYTSPDLRNLDLRMDYLRFNGDTIIMGVVLGGAFGLMSGLTIGLFDLIGVSIDDFYVKYILVFGLSAIPPMAVHLNKSNPQLVSKVSPIVAKIFSPLVLVMLTSYLIAIIYSGKDPYNDREFLLLFNMLLIGVLALIFFSVAETSKGSNRGSVWVLTLLSLITIIVNGIALSAIAFRISEWGITPNRMAVLGVNVIMLLHLLRVSYQLIQLTRKKAEIESVGHAIAKYLPFYFIWTALVVFFFPLIFGFK